jgi:hypothetical protein
MIDSAAVMALVGGTGGAQFFTCHGRCFASKLAAPEAGATPSR